MTNMFVRASTARGLQSLFTVSILADTTLPACRNSHLLPLPFNLPKASANVQQSASLNRRGTLPLLLCLFVINLARGQQPTYSIDPRPR